MECNIKIKEESVECGQRYIENQLFTSTNLEDIKNGPAGNSSNTTRAVKAEIKKEFLESDPRYIKGEVFTSFDLRDLKKEPDEYNSDQEVKAKVKEDLESQLSTSHDLGDLKNEHTSGEINNKNI
uniref:Uncharacterized protein LOC114346711 isoform X3 n=1 Tax=Diabrotica virgifera virgifera TaxID=50390 RepID=A0A6P7GU12_DIAVI